MFSTSLISSNENTSITLSEEIATSNSSVIHHEFNHFNSSSIAFSSISIPPQQQQDLFLNQQKIKKKRNLPGNPDPDAEVIALSPKTLMATNRFVCEICNKGFQRDQNLQLHRRGHNLPWKLKQRSNKDDVTKKRAYVCPEGSCVHHHPSRALGDLTGIKKHYSRKHGEKRWKCEKCLKMYAVQSDWKAHSKSCGTKEYRCDCGTLFSRKDSFITHRAFCDALAEETARLSAAAASKTTNHHPSIINNVTQSPFNIQQHSQNPSPSLFTFNPTPSTPQISLNPAWVNPDPNPIHVKPETIHHHHLLPAISSPFYQQPNEGITTMMTSSPPPAFHGHRATAAPAHLSATALLQKAATVGSVGGHVPSTMTRLGHVTTAAGILPEYHRLSLTSENIATWQKTDRLTRDFLGVGDDHDNGGGADVSMEMKKMLTYTGGIELPAYDRDLLKTRVPETWGNC